MGQGASFGGPLCESLQSQSNHCFPLLGHGRPTQGKVGATNEMTTQGLKVRTSGLEVLGRTFSMKTFAKSSGHSAGSNTSNCYPRKSVVSSTLTTWSQPYGMLCTSHGTLLYV